MTQLILKKLMGEDKSARVGKIIVKAGQKVNQGEGLFNAESAKGNFLVKSEYEGTITSILISEGQQVKIGAEIAEIEVDNSGSANAQQKSGYHFGLAKPKKEEISCDIAVVGGGPGGYVAAIRAAQLGGKVVLIEKNKIGGTCLNTGCIPTKSYVKSAHLYDEIKRSTEFGINVDHSAIDMERIEKRKNEVVSTLSDGIKYLLDHWNIRLIEGEAKFSDGSISVNNNKIDATIQYKNLILAAGSSPIRLPIPGADLPAVMTNEEILSMKKVPKTLTVVGGGIIGMEFAFIFNSFGSEVTVVEYMDEILFTLDEDIIEVIVEECKERGIKIYSKAKVEEILLAEDNQAITVFSHEGKTHFAIGETVLMSVGRRPNTADIDLAQLGVELNDRKNGIKVDDHLRTTNPQIYAIGDITNKIQLAHVASHQGIVAAENCMGRTKVMNYSTVPSAVFLSPEIGVVGLCEKEAKKSGVDYKVSKFPFSANGKALSQGEKKGFVKILYDEKSSQILGAAVVGPGATDLISNFTFFIEHKTDYRTLKDTIYAHPTTAESIHEAILNITGEAVHFV